MQAVKIGGKRRTTDIATGKMTYTERIGQCFHSLTTCGREKGCRNETFTGGEHFELMKHECRVSKFLQLPSDDFCLGLFCRLMGGCNRHFDLFASRFRP